MMTEPPKSPLNSPKLRLAAAAATLAFGALAANFGLDKLGAALRGEKHPEEPTVLTALRKPGFADLVLIAKDGDTTNLKAKNIQIGYVVPGTLDMKGTRDTDLKISDAADVKVHHKGRSGAESDFTLTLSDGSKLYHRPAPALSELNDGKWQFTLPRLTSVSPNLGMALDKAKITNPLPCTDTPALRASGVYACPATKPGP